MTPVVDRPARAGVVTFALAAILLSLARGRFGFWEDEGINLMKAAMVSRGFPLYEAVRSDHAPGLTWLLAAAHRLLGGDYDRMAMVGVGFGALLFAAVHGLARALAGRVAGLVSVLMLAALAPMQKLGASIVLPVAALAVACCALLPIVATAGGDRDQPGSPQRGRNRWLRPGLSGALLGVAIGMRFGLVYFVPIALLALARGPDSGRRMLVPMAAWCAGCLGVLLGVTLVVDVGLMMPQVLTPHVAGMTAFARSQEADRTWLLLAPGFPLLYLATAGSAAVLWFKRRRAAWWLTAWIAIVAAWVLRIRPLWPHHLPELLVPMAVLIGCAAGVAARRIGEGGRARRLGLVLMAAPVLLAVAGLLLHGLSFPSWKRYHDNLSLASLQQVGRSLSEITRPDDFIIVDRPILAYLANRPVPPPLTVVSEKLLRTGELSDADLVQAVSRYHPGVIVLSSHRFDRFDELHRRVAADYTLAIDRVLRTEHGRPVALSIFTRNQDGAR